MPLGPPPGAALLAFMLLALALVVVFGGAVAVVVVVFVRSEFVVLGFELDCEQLFRLKANSSRASRVRVLRIIMSPHQGWSVGLWSSIQGQLESLATRASVQIFRLTLSGAGRFKRESLD